MQVEKGSNFRAKLAFLVINFISPISGSDIRAADFIQAIYFGLIYKFD